MRVCAFLLFSMGLISQFKLADNCRLLLWWEQVALYRMSAGPPLAFAGFQVMLQFSTLTTRCHLYYKEHMASSLMGILFSALVPVLWRIRPNEIGKIKLGHKCVLPHTGLNEVPLASTLGTKTAERKALKDNSQTVPK